MSHDSDTAEFGRAMRQHRKERHERWYTENMAAISASEFTCMMNVDGTALLFREPGRPKVDFYPHTGRWRSEGRTYSGGAARFLGWYARQTR